MSMGCDAATSTLKTQQSSFGNQLVLRAFVVKEIDFAEPLPSIVSTAARVYRQTKIGRQTTVMTAFLRA